MRLAAISSYLLVYGLLSWLSCCGPTAAAAADPYDARSRALRFPPVVDRLPPSKPSLTDKQVPDGESAPNGQRDPKRAVRFPAPMNNRARRFPAVPDREALQSLSIPTVNRRSSFGPPRPLPPGPPQNRPRPRFVSEPRVAPSEGGSSASSAAASNGAESANPREPIGPKPPENTNEWLARDTSLLLKPGKVQTEVGALYTRQEAATVVVLPTGAPVLERIRSRAFIVPFSIRYGWSENLEMFSVVPFGISHFERDNVLAESTEEAGALGDITAGCVYQLPETRFKLPDAAVSFSVTAPTSSSSVTRISGDQASLGNGIWKVGVGFNFVESFDPIVLFGGLGYQYQFEDVQQGLQIQRGDLFNFYCGLGLAVSDDVSLSTQVSGFLQDKTSVNDILIPNSDIEPLSVRLGFVRRLTLKSRIQPYVEFGLTQDAADTTLGIRYIHDE